MPYRCFAAAFRYHSHTTKRLVFDEVAVKRNATTAHLSDAHTDQDDGNPGKRPRAL